MPPRRTILIAACALLALAPAACGDDEGAAGSTSSTTALTTTTTTTAPAEPLVVLVTNDDGIGAVGIDVLVGALQAMDDVEVEVVAPAENQSGSSDTTTPGGAPHRAGSTASGVPGTAVEGYPADTIAVALDELGLEPDLVVSGINTGQNVGPLAYASGTVGAAREAVRRGIPAIAGSAGLTEDTLDDYELAAELVVAHIEAHRADFAAGTGELTAVVNINVPDCTAGTPSDLVEVDLATEIPDGTNPFASDCSIPPSAAPADDVLAVVAGHPALSLVPPEAPAL